MGELLAGIEKAPGDDVPGAFVLPMRLRASRCKRVAEAYALALSLAFWMRPKMKK